MPQIADGARSPTAFAAIRRSRDKDAKRNRGAVVSEIEARRSWTAGIGTGSRRLIAAEV